MKQRVWIVLLVLAALATAAASTAEMQMEQAAYQWAELSDAASLASSLSESTAAMSEETEPDFSVELMELSAAFNIDSIIEGRQHDDGEHDAALLEMEMSSALSPEASPADFFRFARLNSRLYASEKAAAAAFAAFKQNKKAAAEMNAAAGITSESEAVFAATGPLSSMSPTDFVKKVLTAKNPRGKSRGKRVKLGKGKKSKSGSKKSRSVKDGKKSKSKSKSKNSKKSKSKKNAQVGSGRTAGFTGGTAGKSGKAGGYAGRGAKKSGKSGGYSGQGAKKSGKSGGQSGRGAKKSGKTGGESGKGGKKSGKTGGTKKKKSKSGGGGKTVYSSMADGNNRIALPGEAGYVVPAISAATGFTDPKYAAQKKLSAESLRALSQSMGGSIGEQTYKEVLAEMSNPVSNVNRALQWDKQGRPMRAMPEQDHGCGSCWAIAAQQSMQRYWNQANFPGALSIQQLLDCARTADSKGCRGGTPMDAFEYWATNLAASEDDYPTVMKQQQCKKPPFPNTFKGYPSGGQFTTAICDWLVPECRADDAICAGQIMFEVLTLTFIRRANFQPPIAYVDASKWQNYRGGVFPPSMCKSSMAAGNHVVQIVGAGVDNLGIPYWTVDNFWGETWGESGRIRLPFGVNACGLFNFAIYATAPPFAQGGAVRGPKLQQQGTPAPYDPKPIKLSKIDPTEIGAIGRTALASKTNPLPPQF